MKQLKCFLVLPIAVLLSSCTINGWWTGDNHNSDPEEHPYKYLYIHKQEEFLFRTDIYSKERTFKEEEGEIFEGKIFKEGEIIKENVVCSVEGTLVKRRNKITLYVQEKMPTEFYLRELSINKMTLEKDGDILVFHRAYGTGNAVGRFFEYINYSTGVFDFFLEGISGCLLGIFGIVIVLGGAIEVFCEAL